jgi:excisionase family DNA binding protein
MNQKDRLMTSEEVAERLNVSSRMVRYWADNQILPGEKLGPLWVFRETDVEAFAKAQPPDKKRKPGRPRKDEK